jgi:integrase
MALIKRSNTWYVELTVGGKTVRKSTHTSDRSAAERIQELEREVIAKSNAAPTKRWSEASNQWLADNAGKRSAKDDERYAAFWSEAFGDLTLDKITHEKIREAIAPKMKETSGSTANRHLSFLRAVLNAAVVWGWIPVAVKYKRFPEPRGRVRFLTMAEVDKLLAELPEHLRLMTTFALATGQRQGAIRKLTWDAVQLDKGFCWIKPENSKNGRPICVPLNDQAAGVLRSCTGKHEKFVFVYNGAPLRNVNTRAWQKARRRAGIEDFRWHDLRHTWASHHAMNGTPLHALQAMGGWQDANMVQRYAHLSPESLRAHAGNGVYRDQKAVQERL